MLKKQGNFIELQQKIEQWIVNNRNIHDMLLPYYLRTLGDK